MMVDPSHLMMAILHPKDRFTAEPRPALQPWDVVHRSRRNIRRVVRHSPGAKVKEARGSDQSLFALSTNPQAYAARGELRPAQLPWREVRTCRIGEAGTAPTSTAKSRTDAVPHTVLSTHAGAVFQSLPIASTCAVAGSGDDWPAVSVRALPSSGFCLQPL
jgi:hypothetical protein